MSGIDDVEIFDSMFDLRLNFTLSPLLIYGLRLPFLTDPTLQHKHRTVLFHAPLQKQLACHFFLFHLLLFDECL